MTHGRHVTRTMNAASAVELRRGGVAMDGSQNNAPENAVADGAIQMPNMTGCVMNVSNADVF